MEKSSIANYFHQWVLLLRWNKPSGRLILLIPAGWSLWMAPNAPPSFELVLLIIAGGIFASGAGCIANDLWDQNFDGQVTRTKFRPLARGTIRTPAAVGLLIVMLLLCFLIVISLPSASTTLCLAMALLALPAILLYPTAKRWFAYPQAILAICWGFAVLIPWAASESSLSGGVPLLSCWGATVMWTFGFDTVYAMADSKEDKNLGLKSSVLSLGGKVKQMVAISYAIACLLLAIGAYTAGIAWSFWPFWVIATLSMQREIISINKSKFSISTFGRHFRNQVWIGGLLLLGLILGRLI